MVFFFLVIILLGWIANLIWYKPYSVDHFFERVSFQFLWVHPEENTRYRWMESIGLGGRHHLLNNVSATSLKKDKDFIIRQIEMLHSYKRSSLTPSQLISVETLKYYFEQSIYRDQFPFHDHPFNHIEGCHVQLPFFLIHFHLVQHLEDAEEYLERLDGIPEKIEQVMLLNEWKKDSLAYVPNLKILEAIEKQIEIFIDKGLEGNLLYEDFSKKVTRLENVPQESLDEMRYKIRREIEDAVIPAYRNLLEQVRAFKNVASDIAGVWQYDPEYYYYALSEHFGTDYEKIVNDFHPDTLYFQLKEQLPVAKQNLLESFKKLGIEGKNHVECLRKMKQQTAFYYRNDSYGRINFLNDLNLANYDLAKKVSSRLGFQVKAQVEAKRMLDIQEPFFTPFFYIAPSFDGKRSGEIFVRLDNLQELPKFGLPAYAIEWGYLGAHLLQSSIVESKLPSLRKMMQITYFYEGWQHYIKNIALQEAIYEDSKIALIFNLSELHLIAAAMTDIGINHLRWSYDRAFLFFQEQTSMSDEFVQAYLLEMMAVPGKSVAAYFGKKVFEKNTTKVKNALNEKFDFQHFHKFLLSLGAVPLKVLQKSVDDYIEMNLAEKKEERVFSTIEK